MSPEQVLSSPDYDTNKDLLDHIDYLKCVATSFESVLEIGVRCGISTAAFLVGAKHTDRMIYSVDIDERCGKLFNHPQWRFICADSRQVDSVKRQIPSMVDVLFIDGSHEYETVKSDLENYAPIVRQRIIMHDVINKEWPGPLRAFYDYVRYTGRHWEIRSGSFGIGTIYPWKDFRS